jgi:hypothetical protein
VDNFKRQCPVISTVMALMKKLPFVILAVVFSCVALRKTELGEMSLRQSQKRSHTSGLLLLHGFEYEDAAEAFQKQNRSIGFAMAIGVKR